MTAVSETEQALFRRITEGDDMAVGELLLPHVVYLSDFIVSNYPQLDRGMASVEDVVQETLTEAYRQITEFDPNGSASLRTWLATIMNRGPRAVQGLADRAKKKLVAVLERLSRYE